MTQQLRNLEPAESGGSPAGPPPGRASAWLIAGLGTALEAGVLVALAGVSLYGVVVGSASTTSRGITEAIVLLVLGVGLGLFARALFRHQSLAKTPTLLWNVMLLPVAYSLGTGGAPLWGVATAVVAAITLVAAVLVPRYELDDDTVV